MTYAQIVLCQKSGGFSSVLTYSIPQEFERSCQVGCFAQVPLRERLVRGVVVEIQNHAPGNAFKLKPIQRVFDDFRLPPLHIRLAVEMANYYCTSLGKTLRMMVPRAIWEGKFRIPKHTFYHLCSSSEGLKGKKQQEVIRALESVGGVTEKVELTKRTGASFATLSGLVAKGILKAEEKPFYLASNDALRLQRQPTHPLTSNQEKALQVIRESEKPVLLHGVTGSGKTELYLRVILEALQRNHPALLLVPEIALTPQMIDYFKAYVGDALAVFHSKLSEGERALNWYRVQVGQARLVIGSRSAVFAPAESWGCVIVDEEHEWTYKQESTPYYEAHFIVERWQKWMQSKVIFGSATPRLESFHKSRVGEYDYAHLPERIGQTPLPQLQVVDLREEFKARHFGIFSRALLRAMDETLKKGRQVMLFVNQRGSARAVVCRDCGHAAMCRNCEVRLTFHKNAWEQKLVCHYCGQVYPVPEKCPDCDSVYIKHIGVGTQRVEEECRRHFPEVKVLRADQDTTRLKEGFLPLYQAFKEEKAQILVGTQMIAKGLHFEGVDLIGLILADIGLNLPDFRAHERVFQLVTQVSGRSGRGLIPGRVILQTYQPQHFVFQQAQQVNYDYFAEHELELRKKHGYPPFGQLIKFIVVGPRQDQLLTHLMQEKKRLEELTDRHQLNLKVTVAPALVPKLSNQYYFHVLLQGENPHQIFKHWPLPLGWRVDVDPVRVA